MVKIISSLLLALPLLSILSMASPAQAQVSIRIGPPPSRHHVWVPERRYWNGHRYVHVPGRWERRQARREARREAWRAHQRERWQERRYLERR